MALQLPRLRRGISVTTIQDGISMLGNDIFNRSILIERKVINPQFSLDEDFFNIEKYDIVLWVLTKVSDTRYLLACHEWNHNSREWTTDTSTVDQEGFTVM